MRRVVRSRSATERSRTIDLVPRLAMTVTMSTILAARAISVVVPGPTKAAAVARTLDGPIEVACPASALRRHPDVVMFVDEAAATRRGPRSFAPKEGPMATAAISSSDLAINGGTTRPNDAVPGPGRSSGPGRRRCSSAALRSGVWGSIDGTYVKQFEVEFAELQAARHGVTVVNATMGLDGRPQGDRYRSGRRSPRPALHVHRDRQRRA